MLDDQRWTTTTTTEVVPQSKVFRLLLIDSGLLFQYVHSDTLVLVGSSLVQLY